MGIFGRDVVLEKYSNELLTGKPVQYVLGEAWFAGLCLQVNEHTLIPRPETEFIIDEVLKQGDMLFKEKNRQPNSFKCFKTSSASSL